MILLTEEERLELWDKYEEEDPMQVVAWDEVVSKAQLKKVVEYIGGVLTEKKWEALKREAGFSEVRD